MAIKQCLECSIRDVPLYTSGTIMCMHYVYLFYTVPEKELSRNMDLCKA